MEEFSNISLRVQNLWKDFNVLEVIEEVCVLTAEERRENDRIHGELEKSTLLEEIYWRQKSRALFLKEGDRNTKFFDHIANSHRRCNTIDRLMVEGELSTDQGIIEGCITHFYRKLYLENVVHRPLLDRPFDEDEVFGVFRDFKGDKALGPDGFTMAFFSILLEHGEN